MKLQLIRNATLKITYAGKTILADPMLSPKGAFDPFAGVARNPTVELPTTIEEITSGIHALIVTHNHPDHFDPVASASIAKDILVLTQPQSEDMLKQQEFENVTPIETSHTWEGITITRTAGQHGRGKVLELMGDVSGFIFQAEGEPTVYWIGDSIWYEEVAKTIQTFAPDIIITNSGGAKMFGFDEAILMDEEETIKVAQAAPMATIIATHLESLDHCPVTRQTLRQEADEAGIPTGRFFIPNDGECLSF